LRIVFAGTPDFAARHLQALIDEPAFDVVAAYTQPDRPAGRGKKLQPSAVKQLALQHDIPVEQPASLKSEITQQQLADYEPDVMVVVAYGLLLPATVLRIPKFGCINVHGSLLPRWRGAAPIQRAIWAGDKQTGVCIMQMDEGLDTGPVLSQHSLQIDPTETSASLYEKLAQLGPEALVETLKQLELGAINPVSQDDAQATYAKKLSKHEAQIDWAQSAEFIERCTRAFNPWPGSHFEVQGQIVKVWQADVAEHESSEAAPAEPGTVLQADKAGIVVQCGEKALRLTVVQPAGKKQQSAADFLNARSDWFTPGSQLPVYPTESR